MKHHLKVILESQRIGPSGKIPSTAASSEPYSMSSSRGFGELGSTKRDGNYKRPLLDDEEADLSSDDQIKEGDVITCPNCMKEMSVNEAAAHTV